MAIESRSADYRKVGRWGPSGAAMGLPGGIAGLKVSAGVGLGAAHWVDATLLTYIDYTLRAV